MATRTAYGTIRKKGERGSDYGQPRQRLKSRKFEVGDRIRTKDSDMALGTVVRVGTTYLTVDFDGIGISDIHRAEVVHSSSLTRKPRLPNPGNAIKIYGRCLRIEAIKTRKHLYGGKVSTANQKYFHDFTTKNAIIYGLPDGSLLIKAK